ncbi:MAG TPA: VWA domain-containing protein, partial [Terriglobales bacterium]
GGRGGHRGGGGTDLYDAVYLASNDLMSKQQGRKAVIILSDGVDTGSKLSLDEGVQSALKSDTIVYSILFKDDDAYGRPGGGFGYPGGRHCGWGGGGMGGGRFPRRVEHADGKKVLQQISEQTGGRMFEVSKKHPLDEIYQQIQDELRSQYNIGYTPSDRSVGYHKIALTTDQKNALVQTRQGYYARAARTETAAKPGQ